MKVDEKMIEAGAHVLRMATPATLRKATRTLAVQVIEAALSAAPTDYAELVEDAEWLRDIGEQELFVCNVEWQDRLYAIAERIELLSALSGDGVGLDSRSAGAAARVVEETGGERITMMQMPVPSWLPLQGPPVVLPLRSVGAIIMDAGHQTVATCPNAALADLLAFHINDALCPQVNAGLR